MRTWSGVGSRGLVVFLFAVSSASLLGQSKTDWKKELQQEIEGRQTLAKLTAMDGRNIRTPGTVMLLMQSGIFAERSVFRNVIRDGKIRPPGAGGFMSDLMRQAQDDNATRDRVRLGLYQPVFITRVSVGSDSVLFDVATPSQFIMESVNRDAIARFAANESLMGDRLTKTDVSVRRASLLFELPRNVLQTMSRAEVFGVIDALLLRADDERAPQFGTVQLGMTREQVVRNLGKPVNVVTLGDKTVLVFPRIKVTLTNDKVTDVE